MLSEEIDSLNNYISTQKLRYKDKFDEGYDVYRKNTLAAMIDKGIIPRKTELTALNFLDTSIRNDLDTVILWDSIKTQEEKDLYAKMAEVYAGG